jgi:hypothetical protein
MYDYGNNYLSGLYLYGRMCGNSYRIVNLIEKRDEPAYGLALPLLIFSGR